MWCGVWNPGEMSSILKSSKNPFLSEGLENNDTFNKLFNKCNSVEFY